MEAIDTITAGGLASLAGLFFWRQLGRMRLVKPKPIFRSLTFWSGILMMGFICWAWWDSISMWSEATKGAWCLTHGPSGVELSYNGYNSSSPFATDRGIHDPFELAWSRFPLPDFVRGRDERPGVKLEDYEETLIAQSGYHPNLVGRMEYHSASDWVLFIPHWLLLLAVVLPWSGLLLWRARRIRRTAATVVKD